MSTWVSVLPSFVTSSHVSTSSSSRGFASEETLPRECAVDLYKNSDLRNQTPAHGVGRVVGALGSKGGFAGSMLN